MKLRQLASTLCLAWFTWACTGAAEGPQAVFPDDLPLAILPIRDPIDGPELEVEVELVRKDRRERLWTVVDSGFTGVSIPEWVAEGLGLEDIGKAQTRGIAGSVVEPVARADMVFGPLVVSDVVLNRSKQLSVLGQPILGHSPWEVSWTRGTLTLGARAWGPNEATVVLPLRPRADNALDELEVQLQGHPQWMMLDTGAVASTIPNALGIELGLDSEPFHGTFGGAAGAIFVSRAFVADLVLGGVELKDQRLLALKDRPWGLLGRDVLYRYDFLVTPGESLALRPRGDLRTSAATRLGRWDFVEPCETPGCVSARIERQAGYGRLELEVEAEIRRAGRLLFGCADPARQGPLVSMAALLAIGTIQGGFHHIVLSFDRLTKGRYQVRVPHAGALWFSPEDRACIDLVLLDIAPLGNGEQVPAGLTASLRP